MTAPQVLNRGSPSGPLTEDQAGPWLEYTFGAAGGSATLNNSPCFNVTTPAASPQGVAYVQITPPSVAPGFTPRLADFEIVIGGVAATGNVGLQMSAAVTKAVNGSNDGVPSTIYAGQWTQTLTAAAAAALSVQRASAWAGSALPLAPLDETQAITLLVIVDTTAHTGPIWIWRVRAKWLIERS